MCGGGGLGGLFGSGGLGLLGSLIGMVAQRGSSRMPQGAYVAQPPAAAPPSQSAKEPDAGAYRAKNIAGAGGGPSSTLLTGTSGIDDTLLTLGKNTLLGQ